MKSKVITVTMNPALDKTVLVDQFVYGQLNRIKESRIDAGGKGINVAKVLKHFEVEAEAWGLSAGYPGKMLKNKLDALGISSVFIEADGETRTNTKVVDSSSKVTTELNEPGFHANEQLLAKFLNQFEQQVSTASVVVLGGSLPPGAPADYYYKLASKAKEQGVLVVLDADGEAFAEGLKAAPYAVKPNIHELETYFGSVFKNTEEVLAAARQLLSMGIRVVQISMGGDGSILVGEEGAFQATPFPIEPISTVGAGDSMVAAMVYGLLQQLGLEEMARICSAAGTVTASKPGTEVCTLQEVLQNKHLVSITRLG
ncbi:1-phosphofructokinase [Paenibacillus turpanensis]|uniref:1-phosphofructokinase n=1 Tax=Paenibacillus turpanensis TaxID=2689078 RepID=UPI00140830F4|nr:1-phosphofructokinase [Paenibacillus turpanensis]